MRSNIYEIYNIKTMELLVHGNLADYHYDSDSLATQNGYCNIDRPIPTDVMKGSLLNITDTHFSKEILGIVTEVKDSQITFVSVYEIFNKEVVAKNRYGSSIELYITDLLSYFFNNNVDPLQEIPAFQFFKESDTIGNFVWENLPDGHNKIVQMRDILEKAIKEYRIFINYEVDWTAKKINFIIKANTITGLYVDFNTPDCYNGAVKLDLAIKNKLTQYVKDSTTGSIDVLARYYLTKDGIVTGNASDPNRFDYISEGSQTFDASNLANIDQLEEAEKFFKANAKSQNEITFQLKKDSKIYDNQDQFQVGAEITIKNGTVEIESVITGVSYDDSSIYNSYICGFNRKKLSKKLKLGGNL